MVQASRPRAPRGFTLIEILVVCAIIAILLGLAMVRLDHSESNRLNSAAEAMTRLLEAARDESVIRGQPLAFSSDGEGYQFWFSDANRNEWIAQPSTDTIAARKFPEGIVLSSMRINGLSRPLGERIVFSLSGMTEPFALTLTCGSSRLEILADALGRMEIQRAQ
ncbi:GspH/FimT family pseudopilin [Propionivibrio sp.]|uniref:GspH/FimT family pseudopilin n=1 Tax=Propionivibrio sp. TaxID=2212460 RepID=UPI003BF384AE